MGNKVFSFVVGDRTVFVITGSRTQTVNVCTPHNVRGEYDVTYRMYARDGISAATLPTFSSVEELGGWLVSERSADTDDAGRLERTPAPDPIAPAPHDDAWLPEAVRLVEASIDALVEGFVAQPYRHRVEHSLHAELYARCQQHAHLADLHPIGDSGMSAGLVHKEWPERLARPKNGRRRGNFDLALLSPAQLGLADLTAFRFGRIAAPIAIEMGLDYSVEHFQEDAHKLANSEVPFGYLVHLSRGTASDLDDVHALVTRDWPQVRVAYANLGLDGKVAVKLLHDSDVTLRSR